MAHPAKLHDDDDEFSGGGGGDGAHSWFLSSFLSFVLKWIDADMMCMCVCMCMGSYLPSSLIVRWWGWWSDWNVLIQPRLELID